jgi:hypothetical protein
MDRLDVHRGITRSWHIVESLQLGESFANPWPLGVNEEFRDLVLSDEVSYPEVYLKGLGLSYFNFLLTDYSYFQFSWSETDRVRYAYYPNPFLGNSEPALEEFRELQEAVGSGTISFEEYLSLLRDKPADPRVPLFRYENSPDEYIELRHPCSHFHIGHHSDNRWALNKLLTPLAFTLIILKHYYDASWYGHGHDADNEFLNRCEDQLVREKSYCAPVAFSAKEARTFFFS